MANIQKKLKRLKPDVRKWSKRTQIIAGVVAALVLLYVVYGIILYTTGGNDDLTRFVSNFAYYPAAKLFVPGFWPYYLGGLVASAVLVGAFAKLTYLLAKGRKPSPQTWAVLVGLILIGGLNLAWLPPVTSASVSYGQLLDRVSTLDKYQSIQQAQGLAAQASPDQVKAGALRQLLVENRLIQQLATKLDVSVSEKKVDEAYNAQAERLQGEKEFNRLLKEKLGWSVGEYKDELRSSYLLGNALNEKISTDEDLNKGAKEKADKALKQLKSGKSFAAVAKEFSDDPAAAKGGKQGKLQRGQLDPKIEKEAFSLKIGSTSGIIKSSQGFAIIKVESRNNDTVELSQILILGKNLQTYFQEVLPKTKVWVLVDGLKWDKTLLTVQTTKPQPQQQAPQIQTSGTPAAAPPAKSS